MNILESLGFLFLTLIIAFIVFVVGFRLPRRLEALVTIAPIIAFFYVLASLWDGLSPAFIPDPTPHRTATSYRPPTITPAPVSASPTSSSTCLLWSQVTSSMAGRTVCVYGTVIEYRENWENYISNLYFGTRDQFYLVSNYRWDDSPKGDCVTATGEVQLNTYKVPYIKIEDQIDSCQ